MYGGFTEQTAINKTIMKKLALCLTLAAFAFIPALQAGDAKTCDSAKSGCCADKAKTAGDACCAKKLAKKVDVNIKGATLLVQR
jgi:hypothetical protein